MTDINNVTIVGGLVKNAEFRHIGGVTNARFTLAVSRGRKNGDKWEEETSYIDMECWNKLADAMEGRLAKGTKVTIAGYLKQDRWEKDGQQRSKLVVVATEIDVHAAMAPKEQDNGNW